MTPEELRQIEQVINTQMADIRATLGAHEKSARPVEPDNAIGRLTRMEAIGAKHISEASLENARSRLLRLENALKRLDTPDFGICLSCEEEIPVKRLMLLPEAMRCVRCSE